MSDTTVVTSMHAAGWKEYGQRFVATFQEFWPASVKLEIYAEGFTPEIADSRIKITNFDSACGEKIRKFEKLHAHILSRLGVTGAATNYRLQASKFARKGFVITHALSNKRGNPLIWLDADAFTHSRPSDESLLELTQSADTGIFCCYLRRFGFHTESGFLSFNSHHPLAREFVDRYESIYLSGAVFHLEGWTDCHVFDCVKSFHVAEGHESAYFEIPSAGNRHVFLNSPLGLFMDHLKGPRKGNLASDASDFVIPPRSRVKFDGRYRQLQTLIRLFKPKSFIEVGTWSGWRAVSMAMEASVYASDITYRGYDVFEAGTPDLDAREKNVKPHFNVTAVRQLLDFCRFLHPRFSYELVVGDTNSTLVRGDAADFAFLDGGHAVETIESDFLALEGSEVILLDDYYEGPIDIERYGCNRVLEGIPHRVLPVSDPVQGGGMVKFAVVADESSLQLIDRNMLS